MIRRALFRIGCVFTILSIIMMLVTSFVAHIGNDNYAVLQPEYRRPSFISGIMREKEWQLVYVCYGDSAHVNVYSEDGTFKWAVGAPSSSDGGAQFATRDGLLYILANDGYIYQYEAIEGEFVERVEADKVNVSSLNMADTESFVGTVSPREGELVFDAFQVYKAQEDGALFTVVNRPWWYALLVQEMYVLTAVLFFVVMLVGLLLGGARRKNKSAQ